MKKVSIIMGIYNCAETLPEAIESILSQTYSNWELIMCDDGSVDETYQVAHEYVQKYPAKMHLIRNAHNCGLNHTLNRCLEHSTGEYIARMDADDICMPSRLEKEAGFLDSHPEFAIVSCPMIYFDENGDWGVSRPKKYPVPMDFVQGTPFCHAPCMVRTEAYQTVGGYAEDSRTLRAEDYYLWFCMYAAGYRGANLDEPLYKMRDDEKAYNRRKLKYALNEAYVRFLGYRMLHLPASKFVYIIRPVLVNLLPKPLYQFLHRMKRKRAKR